MVGSWAQIQTHNTNKNGQLVKRTSAGYRLKSSKFSGETTATHSDAGGGKKVFPGKLSLGVGLCRGLSQRTGFAELFKPVDEFLGFAFANECHRVRFHVRGHAIEFG